MRLFSCDHCDQVVHFDNRQCVRCGYRLGFGADRLDMYALEPAGEPNWTVDGENRTVRFCANAGLERSISASTRPSVAADPDRKRRRSEIRQDEGAEMRAGACMAILSEMNTMVTKRRW